MAQHQARLADAAPLVDLQLERRLHGLAVGDGELARGAEGDRPRPRAARVHREAHVLAFAHRPGIAERRVLDHQRHAGIAAAERRQRLQLLGQLHAQLVAADDRVDVLDGREVAGREHAVRMRAERLREGLDARAVDLQPGRRAMTAVADQVLRASVQRAEQVKRADAAPRAPPPPAVERDQHDRAVVRLDKPRGDDADHPRVPALAGQDIGAALAKLCDLGFGLPANARLHLAALGVGAIQLRRDLLRALVDPR